MEKVSPELILEVFRSVSKGDLKSIRLVSKSFNEISSPHLFCCVYISIHLKDLEILSAISQHPRLSLFVQEAIYTGVFFHEREIKKGGGLPRDGLVISQDDIDPGRKYYLDRCEEQQSTAHRREDVAIICAALARMPNVKRLIFTNHWYPTRRMLGQWPFSNRRLEDLELSDGIRYGGPLSRAYPEFAKEPSARPLRIISHDGDSLYTDYGFTVMSRALSITSARIRTLSIDYIVGPTGGISAVSFHMAPRDLVHSCNAFRYLHKIEFSLWMGNTEDERDILMQGNLAKVLAAAEDLEELSFEFNYRVHHIPLKKCLGTHTWAHLRSIELYRKEMHGEELVALIKRHCKTLKTICLDSINLKSGTWLDVAKELHQWISVEHISLKQLGERVDHWNVRKAETSNLKELFLHGESDPIYDPDYRPGTPISFNTNFPPPYDQL